MVVGKDTLKYTGYVVTALIFYYIYLQVKAEVTPALDDLRLALTIIMFVWILNWMRNLLGSPRLALLLALVVSYLVFFKHPNLLFAVFGMMFLIYFIKPFFSKATDTGPPPQAELMNFYKEMAEKSKNVTINISPPGSWPFYYPPQPQQPQQGGNK